MAVSNPPARRSAVGGRRSFRRVRPARHRLDDTPRAPPRSHPLSPALSAWLAIDRRTLDLPAPGTITTFGASNRGNRRYMAATPAASRSAGPETCDATTAAHPPRPLTLRSSSASRAAPAMRASLALALVGSAAAFSVLPPLPRASSHRGSANGPIGAATTVPASALAPGSLPGVAAGGWSNPTNSVLTAIDGDTVFGAGRAFVWQGIDVGESPRRASLLLPPTSPLPQAAAQRASSSPTGTCGSTLPSRRTRASCRRSPSSAPFATS